MVTIEADDPDAREWHTLRAAERGSLVIAGGRLPVDHVAHRVGEPDLLVRYGDGYLPVDVKSHKSLDAVRKPGMGTALVSKVTQPYLSATTDPTTRLGSVSVTSSSLLTTAGFSRPPVWPRQ